MLNISRTSLLLLIAILLITGPGCILGRLWKTHSQLCCHTPEIRFQKTEAGGTPFVFAEPTLLEKDVIWLMGADAPGPVANADALFDGSGLVERVKAR
jgi:hypothetical protein